MSDVCLRVSLGKNDGPKDDCRRLTSILKPDDKPPAGLKHVCPERARHSCLTWLHRIPTPYLEFNTPESAEAVANASLMVNLPLGDDRYVIVGYRRSSDRFEIEDDWPFPVTGARGCLWLVLRQTVTAPVHLNNRLRANMQSPRWALAKKNFLDPMKEDTSFVKQADDQQRREFAIQVALSCLSNAGLPVTLSTAKALIFDINGELRASLFLPALYVTTFLLRDMDKDEASEIVQSITGSALFADDHHRQAAIGTAQKHVTFLESMFPEVHRATGHKALKSRAGTSVWEHFLTEFGPVSSVSDWNRLHQRVQEEAHKLTADPDKAWRAVKEVLRRRGVTRKALDTEAR